MGSVIILVLVLFLFILSWIIGDVIVIIFISVITWGVIPLGVVHVTECESVGVVTDVVPSTRMGFTSDCSNVR